MNCNDVQIEISAYADGELSGSDARVMFAHLSACAECQAFLTDTLRLRAELRTWEVRIPAPTPGQKRAALRRREATGGVIRRLISRRLEMPFAAAAGIALVLLGVSLFSVSLWLGGSAARAKNPEVVYMLSMPAVEVRAVKPADLQPVQ